MSESSHNAKIAGSESYVGNLLSREYKGRGVTCHEEPDVAEDPRESLLSLIVILKRRKQKVIVMMTTLSRNFAFSMNSSPSLAMTGSRRSEAEINASSYLNGPEK